MLQIPPSSNSSRRRNRSPRTHGQPEPHRYEALKQTAKNNRHQGRSEATARRPSAGNAPRAPEAVEADPPSTTRAAAGRLDPLHPPDFHQPRSIPSIHQAKGQRNEPPANFPGTATPPREHHLHRPTSGAGEKHRRDGDESARTYSKAPPSPPPRRRRQEPKLHRPLPVRKP